MKFLLKSLLVFILAATIASCSKTSGISGQLEGAENLTIYFDQLSFDNTTQGLGQTKADGSGSFHLEIPEGLEAGLYRVRAGSKSIELLLDGSESLVKINGSLAGLNKFEHTVEGSSNTQAYLDIMKKFIAKEVTVDQLKKDLVTMPNALAASNVAMKLFQTQTGASDIHSAIATNLKNAYPDNTHATKYKSIADQIVAQAAREKAQQKVKIGEVAPDIALDNLDGKEMKLSDLKGSVVLIDFWASWCGPCRKANPHVVEMYHKYKQKGFTVYSVSLDGLDSRTKARFNGDANVIADQMKKQKDRWKAAIAQDKLAWPYHVSDLKKWESDAAALYGVRSIPRTFLLDREGKIAALNPRGDLESQIKKLLDS